MIYYETYGNKFNPVILFLHGESYVYSFAKQYELQKNYYLVVPHIPGFGKAAKEEYSTDKAVEQIAELAAFFGRQVTLVGFSLGAQLCLPLMCKYPELFNGCVMISPWLLKTTEDIEKAIRQVDDIDKKLKSPITVNMSAVQLGLNAEQRRAHAEYCKDVRINTIVSAVDNGINLDDYPEYADIDKPMLALCGLKELLEVRKTVRMLSQKNPHCTYDMWDGAVHNIPYKYPARLNKVLEEFVDKANTK